MYYTLFYILINLKYARAYPVCNCVYSILLVLILRASSYRIWEGDDGPRSHLEFRDCRLEFRDCRLEFRACRAPFYPRAVPFPIRFLSVTAATLAHSFLKPIKQLAPDEQFCLTARSVPSSAFSLLD